MKKIFTLIAMATMALGANAQDWNASNADQLPNGTTILNNDFVKIVTAVQDTEAALLKDATDNPDPKTFGGYTFTKYVNIRIDEAPAESNDWVGTAYGDATPLGISLVVTVKKHTDLTLYYTHGDGKALSCYDQTDKVNTGIAETAVEGLNKYYTGTFKFIAGHTYTIFAKGGTTGLNGITTAAGTYVEPTTTLYTYNNEDANLTTYKDGAKLQMTGNTGKNFGKGANITVNGTAYASLKNSNGVQITFTAAPNEKIYRMIFYAIPNKDTEAPKFQEFNGIKLTDPIEITTVKDGTKPTQTIMCVNGASSVTFTYGGKQVNFVFEVDYNESAYDAQYEPVGTSGISTIKNETINLNAPMFNLAGQKVAEGYKGVVIQNGVKRIQK